MAPVKGKQSKRKQVKTPAEALAKTIWFLPVSHQGQLSFGDRSYLVVPADTNVEELKEMIKEKKRTRLGPFDASDFEVWTYKHKAFSSDPTFNKLEKIVGGIEFSKASKNPKRLSTSLKVTKIDLPGDVILLVRVPPPQTADIAGGGDESRDGSGLFQQYRSIFINVTSWDGFQQSDLLSNKLKLRESPPDFVVEFRQKLDSKPALSPDVPEWFLSSLSLPDRAAYFDMGEASTDQRRYAELSEVGHIIDLACLQWEQLWQEPYGHDLEKDVVDSMFFHRFILGVPEDGNILAKLSEHPWPLRLGVIRSAETIDKLRDYTPHSDFLIATSTLPRLLVEVNSTKMEDWPPDLIRMLLSGASVVRFSNEFLEEFRTNKQFVLVAMFIQQTGQATRYFLYQLENGPNQAVYYTKDACDLNIPVGRVEFARQLYNFLSVLGEEEELTMTPIEQLDDKIEDYKEEYGMKSLVPKNRPSLLEWQTSSALPVLDGAKVRRVGKRKASRPRQDVTKVDEGEGLNKKRRLCIR